MDIFIAFLRGVNMTGHNSIRMKALAELFASLGFLQPETFIQSGNVVFGTEGKVDRASVSTRIEEGIKDQFGFDVPALIRTAPELRAILEYNPYLGEKEFDAARTAVIFLHEAPTAEQLRKVADVDYPPDKFTITGKEIYTFCPDGFAKTKLYTNFFENKMKVTGTARNLKTISTVLKMAEKRL
jgi:uncharacterized protein (DUF1697 family)